MPNFNLNLAKLSIWKTANSDCTLNIYVNTKTQAWLK
jgi:hypothetical protein